MAHILLYGGTFDPIHHGHLITCQKARELLGADRILLVPAAISPHKTAHHGKAAPPSSPEHRIAMIKLAIENSPHFAIDAREIERAGPSYTADTLDELEREFAGDHITLLIGADQLPKFHSWVRVRDILATTSPHEGRGIAILGRPFERPANTLEVGFEAIRANLGDAVAERLRKAVLTTPLIEISATDIRDRVRRDLPIDYLVPPAVAAYIRKQQLYR